MKITLTESFLEWFKKTNTHLYEDGADRKELPKEITDYVNDVLTEHMETFEAELNLNVITDAEDGDDATDSGFVEGDDKLF